MIELTDFSKIQIKTREKWFLFRKRFQKEFELPEKYMNLYYIDFVDKVGYDDFDDVTYQMYYNGKYALTDNYFLYCVYRRDKFFHGTVWPVIVSGIVSVITSIITTMLTIRLGLR